MKITALVNGKQMELTIMSTYNNGRETVYECTTADGVWVAVEESTVTKAVSGVKTRFDYKGGDVRAVEITINGKSEQAVDAALEALNKIVAKHGYSTMACGMTEEVSNGKFRHIEFIEVDNKDHADYVKKTIYAEFKSEVK